VLTILSSGLTSQRPCYKSPSPAVRGRCDAHRRLGCDQFLPFVAQLPPAVFVLEACGMDLIVREPSTGSCPRPPEAFQRGAERTSTPTATTEIDLTAEQVGPTHGRAGNNGGLRGRFIDWLPCVRIPSWPGAPGSSNVRGRRYACSPPCSAQDEPNDARKEYG